MTIPHVTSGQKWAPLPAAQENQVRDAADWVAQQVAGNTFDRASARPEPDIILVRNMMTPATQWNQFDAVQVNPHVENCYYSNFLAPINPAAGADQLQAWKNREIVNGWEPFPLYNHSPLAYTFGAPGRLAILLEPAAQYEIARAVVSGVVHAQITVSEEWHEYADTDPVSGGRTLVSCASGQCQVLWKEQGLGSRWALLRLGNAGSYHLVGVPQGPGISARSSYVPGSGVVRLYFLDRAGNLQPYTYNASVGGPVTTPCYLTVYSLSDDPILNPQTHQYGGQTYTGYGAGDEYYLLHCDRFGAWWIEPHARVQLAKIGANLTGTLQSPAGGGYSATGYFTRDGYEDLDNAITNPLAGVFEDSVCQIRQTGDYAITLDWDGGEAERITGSTDPQWYTVAVSAEYAAPGGSWSDVFAAVATPTVAINNRVTKVLVGTSLADPTGRSLTTVIRLTAGGYLRIPAVLARLSAADTIQFHGSYTSPVRARLTLTKHV